MDKCTYNQYIKILQEELLPAMGCTEPIALAYAAAIAKDVLGELPTAVEISVSGNILKNVKSVIVPGTGGLKGITAAVSAGIIAGNADKQLQVLENIDPALRQKISDYMKTADFKVTKSSSGCIFDICVKVFCGGNSASARIAGHHTNVVTIKRNDEVIGGNGYDGESDSGLTEKSCLTVKGIVEFCDCLKVDDVREVIQRQIDYNSAISAEGLSGDYGARVGKILLGYGDDVHNLAKAHAAAGSDARMNGCTLPVVIVSGSGNQGITASLPVIVYARHLNKTNDELIRALTLSDLITIHLKTGIGRLSAYCGAVSAGAGAGAGVCYLKGGTYNEVAHTVTNAIAITSGLICDGAKSSCAAKIAAAVDAGLMGMEMSGRGSDFCCGDGIIESGVENTIDNVCDIARNGMKSTDEEIIRLMIKNIS